MKKINQYLRIRDAAKLLGISVGALRYWEKTKKVPVYRLPNSNHRLYDPQDLEEYLGKIETSLINKDS